MFICSLLFLFSLLNFYLIWFCSHWQVVQDGNFLNWNRWRILHLFCTLVEFHMGSMRRRWKVLTVLDFCFSLFFSHMIRLLLSWKVIVFMNLCFVAYFAQFGTIKRLRIARNKKVKFVNLFFTSLVFAFTCIKYQYDDDLCFAMFTVSNHSVLSIGTIILMRIFLEYVILMYNYLLI